MVYSRDWATVVEATPLGSADPGTIDDRIREKMVDIKERMNDVVTSWTTDPVVPKSQLRLGLKLFVPAVIFSPEQDEDDVAVTGTYVQSDSSATDVLYIALPVQSNWKITAVRVLADKHLSSTLNLDLRRVEFDTSPTDSSIASAVVSSTGVQMVSLFSGVQLANGFYFYLRAVPGNNRIRVYGVEVTYDEV